MCRRQPDVGFDFAGINDDGDDDDVDTGDDQRHHSFAKLAGQIVNEEKSSLHCAVLR